MEPRPNEGDAPNQRWQLTRPADDREPVGGFGASLSGPDTSLHLLIGQGRLLTLRQPIASEQGTAVIAVGDPTVVDFDVLPDPRMIRLLGKRAGVTDLSITTADGKTFSFEVNVTYDIDLLNAQLRQTFPDALINVTPMREHLIVEGQARSSIQVARIINTIGAYLESASARVSFAGGGRGADYAPGRQGSGNGEGDASQEEPVEEEPPAEEVQEDVPPASSGGYELSGRSSGGGPSVIPRIVNLIRVPGVQQVMLKVRIAEIDRQALRAVGADILSVNPRTGNIVGTQIGGGNISAAGATGTVTDAAGFLMNGLIGAASAGIGSDTTAYGIFPSGDWELLLRALRRNSVLKVIAEPNLVALNGHQASFLAGGEFPITVPQTGGAGGAATVTVEFKPFGVQLEFVPLIIDDETIRLSVRPEVSRPDFDVAVTLVQGGSPVPGTNTRVAETTVELRQGQTLALAGLMDMEVSAGTTRIPFLGDLPYIGPFFSSTDHQRNERELLVMVTPYLVEPMNPDEVPPLPGEDVMDPNDCEFYFLNRIEGRTGVPHRPTTNWDNPLHFVELMELERRHVCGPVGHAH